MDSIDAIEERRRQILEDMGRIRSLERGALSEQMLRGKAKGAPVLRGPYFVLSHWEEGRSRCRRVKAGELEQVQQDVANHRQFRALCNEFAELTERLGHLERELGAETEVV